MDWIDLKKYMHENELHAYPLYTDPKTQITGHTATIYSKDKDGSGKQEQTEHWCFYEMQHLKSFTQGLQVSEKDVILSLDSIGDASFAMLEHRSKIDLVPESWLEAILNFEKAIYIKRGWKEKFLLPPYTKINQGFKGMDISKKRFFRRWQYFNNSRLKRISKNLKNLTILPKSSSIDFLQNQDLSKYNKILINSTCTLTLYFKNYTFDLLTILREKTNPETIFYAPDIFKMFTDQYINRNLFDKGRTYRKKHYDFCEKEMKKYDLIIDKDLTDLARKYGNINKPVVFRNKKLVI